MKKKFITNFALLFVVNLLVKPSWVVTDLWVQRNTEEAYGAYFAVFNLAMLFNILLDLGINNFNTKKVGALENKANTYFGRIISIKTILSLIYILIILPIGWYLGVDLNHLLILAINQILLGFILYFRSNLGGLKLFKTDSLISVLDRVIMLFIVLFFALNQLSISISDFIWIQFTGYLAVFSITFLATFRKIDSPLFSFDWRFSKRFLLKSYPYAVIIILMSGYIYSDSIMMKAMLIDGDYNNMIYAHSFRIIMSINNYTYLIAVLLIPMYAKMIQQKEDIAGLLKLSGSIVILGLIIVAIYCNYYQLPITKILYGKLDGLAWWERGSSYYIMENTKEIQQSSKVFGLLIFAIVPMSFNYIYGSLLTAAGEIKTLNKIAFGGLLLNILMNFFLIPDHGAYGAGISSVFTQFLTALFQVYFAYKLMKIKFSIAHSIKFLSIILTTILIVHYFLESLSWWLGLILLVAFAFTGLLVLKVVEWKDIKKYVINRKG